MYMVMYPIVSLHPLVCVLHVCPVSSAVPSDCTEPVEALGYFSERFTLRYGDTHPLFFDGDLTDAVKEATGGSAEEVSVP